MTNEHEAAMRTGYTVTKAIADGFVANRDDSRLMVMERNSNGGYGVWDLDGSFWVYINLHDSMKAHRNDRWTSVDNS